MPLSECMFYLCVVLLHALIVLKRHCDTGEVHFLRIGPGEAYFWTELKCYWLRLSLAREWHKYKRYGRNWIGRHFFTWHKKNWSSPRNPDKSIAKLTLPNLAMRGFVGVDDIILQLPHWYARSPKWDGACEQKKCSVNKSTIQIY